MRPDGFGTSRSHGPSLGIADRQRVTLPAASMISLQQHRRDTRARRRCCRSRTPNRRAASSVDGSTSSASKSRMALAYSARFNRWSNGGPDSDERRPQRSSAVVSQANERARASLRRARHALRRHHADAHLADDLFPGLRTAGQIGDVNLYPASSRRSWCARCGT